MGPVGPSFPSFPITPSAPFGPVGPCGPAINPSATRICRVIFVSEETTIVPVFVTVYLA